MKGKGNEVVTPTQHTIDDLDWLARQAKDLYHALDRHEGRDGLNQRIELAKNHAFARWQRRAKKLRKALKEEYGK